MERIYSLKGSKAIELAPQGMVVTEEIKKAGKSGIERSKLVTAVKRRLRSSEAKNIGSTVSFYLGKLKELGVLSVKTVPAAAKK